MDTCFILGNTRGAGQALYSMPSLEKESDGMSPKRNILLVVMPYLLPMKNLKNAKVRSFRAFPYGVLSIATYLKNHAAEHVNIEIIDCNFSSGEDYLDVLQRKIMVFQPDIVGLSMMFDNSYQYVSRICSVIKEYKNNTLIVMGGQAASSSYAYILEDQPAIDGICFQDGEVPLLRLATGEQVSATLNEAPWMTMEKLKQNQVPQKMVLQNIDEVIDIDYRFVDVEGYSMEEAFSPFSRRQKGDKQFFLVTSRGCPFKCVFCMHSAHDDRTMRYADVDKLIKHVEHLITRHKMNIMTIYDDQLLFYKDRAKEIFRRLANFNIRVECPNGLSVAYIDEEMAMLMRQAGMDTAALAIESGSPYVLNQLIHKPLKLDKVGPVVGYLRKYGFWIQGFFVTGIPGEKDEHREETINFIRTVGLDWSGFSCASPIPGSKLHQICVDHGYIEKNIKLGGLDTNKYIITTPEYKPHYIVRKTYLMNLDVNFVHNYRMRTGDYEIAAKAFADIIARYNNHAFAYYYLAEAYARLGKGDAAKKAKRKFNKIMEEDNFWKDYVEYFRLK
jgi:anaerobic magnesium-protoporphyrin IX monomethyl ester cyclase